MYVLISNMCYQLPASGCCRNVTCRTHNEVSEIKYTASRLFICSNKAFSLHMIKRMHDGHDKCSQW